MRTSIENVKVKADRINKKIILTWKLDVDKVVIYKADGTNTVTLYKSIHSSSKQFIDEQVALNIEYNYYLKVVYKNGEESGLGEKIGVKF